MSYLNSAPIRRKSDAATTIPSALLAFRLSMTTSEKIAPEPRVLERTL